MSAGLDSIDFTKLAFDDLTAIVNLLAGSVDTLADGILKRYGPVCIAHGGSLAVEIEETMKVLDAAESLEAASRRLLHVYRTATPLPPAADDPENRR